MMKTALLIPLTLLLGEAYTRVVLAQTPQRFLDSVEVEVTDPPATGVVKLPTDAFQIIMDEKGAELCYYHRGHFLWLTTDD